MSGGDTDLTAIVEACRRGLELELVLLAKLDNLSMRQRAHAERGELDALQRCADERDAVTTELLGVEQTVRHLRAQLAAAGTVATALPGFSLVAALHERIVAAVQAILSVDASAIQSLESIVSERRAEARALDRAGSTLEAYGRVTAPESSAALMSDRG